MRFNFGPYSLDTSRRELRRGARAIAVEPQVFDLLLCLIRNRDCVVSKDEILRTVWRGRIVSEATLNSRINSARRAIGDTGKKQQYIRTVMRRGLRFVGEVEEEANDTAHDRGNSGRLRPIGLPRQEIRFIRTSDGVRLAAATVGEGMPLVKATNWLNHLEFDWHSPVWSPLLTHLAANFRLIRYDGRGFGLSDWSVDDLSFESYVRDLEAVVNDFGAERVALLGISGGVSVSIAFAARHPERVSRLVLYGGFPHGWFRRGNAAEIAQAEALISMIRHGWGADGDSAFHRLFTGLFVPGGTPEQIQWFKDLQRISTSPENAARLASMFGQVDVTNLLPHIAIPTLILHSRHDSRVPYEQGLMLARGIPGAQFVALESCNHILLSHEPAWGHFIDHLCSFVSQASTSATARPATNGSDRRAP